MLKQILPTLEMHYEEFNGLLSTFVTEKTIIVSDRHNYDAVCSLATTVLADTCSAAIVEEVQNKFIFDRVLAVGGCTSLDIGRACAIHRQLYTFPTILSTTCISNNRSRLWMGEKSELVLTSTPIKTILNIPALLESPPDVTTRWTSSGFGDLFANISASVDVQLRSDALHLDDIRQNVPEAFEALEWSAHSFRCYDEPCMVRLAHYLHNASLDVILRGNMELSAGSEHDLYNKIFLKNLMNASNISATHGQIVAIGSLVAAKILEEQYGIGEIYAMMSSAFPKLGLPVSLVDLQTIGISKNFLKSALGEVDGTGLLGEYFQRHNFDIIDELFQ